MRPAGFFGGLLVLGFPVMLFVSALGIITGWQAIGIGIISLVLGSILIVADS